MPFGFVVCRIKVVSLWLTDTKRRWRRRSRSHPLLQYTAAVTSNLDLKGLPLRRGRKSIDGLLCYRKVR